MSNNWIFLRGLTRGNVHWGDFPEIFMAANPGAQVEYLEIPGNGLLCNEVTPVDPEEVIKVLKNKSKLAQGNNTYHLCGISLGGMIALKWCEMHEDSVESITVINSSLPQNSSFYQRLKPRNYLTLLKILFTQDSYEQESHILNMTSNNLLETKKYLERYANFSSTHKVTRMNFLRQLILASKIRVKKIRPKKLFILSAAHDSLVHCLCSQKIANDLEGELLIHSSAGHDIPLDAPEWVAKHLVSRIN
jgi:homoserine acetyltransferase